MSRALFVGRFQPFHKGHLRVVMDIAREHEKIIIIIGSAQEKRTEKNPFSVRERKDMIKAVLDKLGLNYEIHAVKDYFDCKSWVREIKRLCKFDVVYSTNPWTIECFEEYGIKVIRHRMYRRYMLSGTKIREMIRSGNDWKDFVPDEVFAYIESMKREGKL